MRAAFVGIDIGVEQYRNIFYQRLPLRLPGCELFVQGMQRLNQVGDYLFGS